MKLWAKSLIAVGGIAIGGFAIGVGTQTATILSGAYLQLGTAPQHEFVIRGREIPDLSFPVATLMPVAPGKKMALDITPSPGAEETGDGIAWIDVCDEEVQLNPKNQTRCGRITMKTVNGARGAVFSAINFNGAKQINLYLETGRTPRWAVGALDGHLTPVGDSTYSLGSPTDRLKAIYIAEGDVGQALRSLQERVGVLEARKN